MYGTLPVYHGVTMGLIHGVIMGLIVVVLFLGSSGRPDHLGRLPVLGTIPAYHAMLLCWRRPLPSSAGFRSAKLCQGRAQPSCANPICQAVQKVRLKQSLERKRLSDVTQFIDGLID